MISLIFKPFEAALNAYINLAPTTQEKISELSGKVIEIQLKPMPIKCYLIPDHDRLHVKGHYIGQVDTTIIGNPLDFARMDGLAITGDAEVAQKLAKIFSQHDIDWEEHLSHYVGDVTAHQIANFIKQLIALANRTKDHITENLGEYLQEEVRLTPPSEEVNDFIRAVDQLRDDVERLAAQIKLEQQS